MTIRGTDDLTCRELVELVTDYLEGTLPPPERARFEAHLSRCRGCRTYLAQMRETLRLVGRLDEDALTSAARDELLDIFRAWKRG